MNRFLFTTLQDTVGRDRASRTFQFSRYAPVLSSLVHPRTRRTQQLEHASLFTQCINLVVKTMGLSCFKFSSPETLVLLQFKLRCLFSLYSGILNILNINDCDGVCYNESAE